MLQTNRRTAFAVTRSVFIHRSVFICVLGLAPMTFAASPRTDWPDFRGPRGDGHVAADDDDAKPIGLPLHWSETNNVKWKTPIPPYGISTPIIMDGQVWLTTAAQDGHDFFALRVDA